MNLLKLREELRNRGFIGPESVEIEHIDVTDLFAGSPLEYLHRENWEDFIEQEGRRPGFESGEGPFCVRAVVTFSLK